MYGLDPVEVGRDAQVPFGLIQDGTRRQVNATKDHALVQERKVFNVTLLAKYFVGWLGPQSWFINGKVRSPQAQGSRWIRTIYKTTTSKTDVSC